MKKNDFFDNLNVVFANSEEKEDYAFTKAVIYRDIKTGKIESIQVINTEYNEFMVIERDGEASFINIGDEVNGEK